MKRIVGFVRHRQDATAVERAFALKKIVDYAERTGASIAQTFEVPSNVSSEQADLEVQRMLQFVKKPAGVVSMIVLPSMRDLPRGFDALVALERARQGSHLELVVLDLEGCTSRVTALDVHTKLRFASRFRAQAHSERIKQGMRRAKGRQGGRA